MDVSALETILLNMFGALSAIEGNVTVERNIDVPEIIPADGLIILSDGKTEPTEPVLGGVGTLYAKTTPTVAVFVSDGDPANRDAKYDLLVMASGKALGADPTFGGAAYGSIIDRPEPIINPILGASGVKGGIIDVHVEYAAPSALG